ncbi:hypothetical protein [Flavobacterium sp. ACN6]|uniref:hypothetical protein n=1 Tax=Flavobacterium sp. ACN6 TaxID=1920426 RepID=UPI000BB3ACC8|nr:hypothetical protein [Flavobacterium sp. ACN6]PBJ05626.1 hypothetical protein BSF42_42700 [Flavobacterium sp. ACN6]
METPPIFLKVLQILADRYGMSCSLEELTRLTGPAASKNMHYMDQSAFEKESQASILDMLLVLNDQGLIFLNPDNDRSVITIKGLIKVHHKILCN